MFDLFRIIKKLIIFVQNLENPIIVEVEERFSDNAEVQRHRMTFASNALVHTLNTILIIHIHW